MTSSFFRRPQTSTTRVGGRIERPNRLSGADRVRVTRQQSGRFKDYSSPEIIGQNASQGFAEVGNFLEKVIDTAIPAAKDLMQDFGVREAQGLLGDPDFVRSLREKGGEGRVLYDRLNPFGQEVIDKTLAEGVVQEFNSGMDSALFSDDLLTRTPTTPEEAATQRTARIERLDGLLQETGFENLPTSARAQAMQGVAALEGRARGLVRTAQTATDVNQLDTRDATAITSLLTLGVDNQTLGDAFDSGAQAGTPEEREAVATEARNVVTNVRQRIVEIAGSARTPRSAAELLAQSAEQLAGTEGGAAKLELLELALVDLEVDGVQLGNQLIGKSGKSLINVVRESQVAADSIADREDQDRINSAGLQVLQQMDGVMKNDQLSLEEKSDKLAELEQQFFSNILTQGYDLALIEKATRVVAGLRQQAGLPIQAESMELYSQLKFDMNAGTLTQEEANARAAAIPDAQVRLNALQDVKAFKDGEADPSSASNNNGRRREANRDIVQRGARDVHQAMLEGPQSGAYESSGITALRTGQGVNGSWEERITNRGEQQFRARVDANAASDKPEKLTPELLDQWYREEQENAVTYFLSDKGQAAIVEQVERKDTAQALQWNEQIKTNLKDVVGTPSVAVFPTEMVDLYKQLNEGKPVNYAAVSKWYVGYMGPLKNPDGTAAFKDPRKTWRGILDVQKPQEGVRNDAPNPASGPMAAPLGFGMIDPRATQAGLEKLASMFGLQLDLGQSTEAKPVASQEAAKPTESNAPRLEVLALSALTGTASPYPVVQTANSDEQTPDPTQMVINQEEWATFRRIWGSPNNPQSGQPYRPNTPPLPQVVATKPIRPVRLTMASPNHPNVVLIGLNEGTRTPNGGYTQAYYGHSDPISGYNQGSFSAQQGYNSPQQADRAWMGKVNSATGAYFLPAMRAAGLQRGTAGFDRLLFNLQDAYIQSPEAVTASGGLLDRIPEMVQRGLTIEAIAKSRADSYINPTTGRLETGFANYTALLKDQRSRAGTWDYKRRIGS